MALKKISEPVGKKEFKDKATILVEKGYQAHGFYIGNDYFEKITFDSGEIQYYKLD